MFTQRGYTGGMTSAIAADPESVVRIGPDPADPVTVFVGGCERSGTTLAGRILAEQLSLVAVPEAYFHAVAYRRFGPRTIASTALRHWRRRSWGITENDRGRLELTDFLRAELRRLYERRRGGSGPVRVVESTPENIEIGSILLEEFPEAHIVHMVRDPRGVAASLRRVDFGPRSAQECARLWKQRVASGLALEAMYPDRVHRLRYEDLVVMPTAIGSLGDCVPRDLDHEFDAARDVMIDHTSAAVQGRAESSLDIRRAWAWRRELSKADVGVVEYECRELMRLFDYRPDGFPDGRASTHRRLDTLRSTAGELTFGTTRRALRAGWAVTRATRWEAGRSAPRSPS